MNDLMKCEVCKYYTLEMKCKVCNKKTISAHYQFSKLRDAVQKNFKKN